MQRIIAVRLITSEFRHMRAEPANIGTGASTWMKISTLRTNVEDVAVPDVNIHRPVPAIRNAKASRLRKFRSRRSADGSRLVAHGAKLATVSEAATAPGVERRFSPVYWRMICPL